MEIATKQKVYRRGGSAVFHCILQPLTLHMCHGSLTALQPLTISAWLSKPKSKKRKTKKPKKNDKTQLSATTPPLGCAILFFVFFWFLVFWFVVGFSAMAKQNQNQKRTLNKKTTKNKNKMTRPNSLPLLPPLGCAILVFLFFFCFLGFCFFVFLVSCFCCFLVFWFLVFWFVVGFLKG